MKILENGIFSGILKTFTGLVFLYYGLTRKPLELNPFNPWQKPVPVFWARLLYLPMAILCLFVGLRDFVRVLVSYFNHA